MTNDLLNLWITRLADKAPASGGIPEITAFGNNPGSNLLVVGKTNAAARRIVIQGLTAKAHADSVGSDRKAWLAIDIPIPNRARPTVIIHRMIRRLYFAAVLQGLAELEPFRDAVQALRLSYLQTRGTVTSSTSDEITKKLGGEVSASLDILNPLSAKLTAEAEVKVAQELSAEMARLDLYEAEDQLACDLQLLAQLELFVSRYNMATTDTLPRWEQIRNVFRLLYSNIKRREPLALRPVFVLEAGSPSAVVSLLAFLTDAASLATAHGAQLIVTGGPELAAAWRADKALNAMVFRDRFAAMSENLGPISPQMSPVFQRLLKGRLRPDVAAVIERIVADAPTVQA